MDDVLYEACKRYFTALAHYGYKDEMEVRKLLLYIYIQELVNIYPVSISGDDYTALEKALYCIYGTTCLIPYPTYCDNPIFLHLGSRPVDPEVDPGDNPPSIKELVDELDDRVTVLEGLDYVLEGESPSGTP